MINVLFAAKDKWWIQFEAPLRAAFEAADLEVTMARAMAPSGVDYIIYAPNSDVQDFGPFTRAKAVLNLWAGVETAVGNDTLTLPFARMVEPGLSEGMRDWVIAHAMRLHAGIDAHTNNPDHVWDDTSYPPLARQRKVAILGLGELGRVCAEAFLALGFNVSGFSRTPKTIPGVETFAGAEMGKAVAGADILLLLLPLTSATENLVDETVLSALAPGAVVLNPGRGPLIDDDALLAALDRGHLSHATLDVFREEPLPQDHPFWGHPKVTVTPHIASTTRPDTAAQVIAEQIQRGEAGEPLLHLVDRTQGY